MIGCKVPKELLGRDWICISGCVIHALKCMDNAKPKKRKINIFISLRITTLNLSS